MYKKLLLLLLLTLASLSAGYSPGETGVDCNPSDPNCNNQVGDEKPLDKQVEEDHKLIKDPEVRNELTDEELETLVRNVPELIDEVPVEEVNERGDPELTKTVVQGVGGPTIEVNGDVKLDEASVEEGKLATQGEKGGIEVETEGIRANNLPLTLNEDGSADLGEGLNVANAAIDVSCEGGINCEITIGNKEDGEGKPIVFIDETKLPEGYSVKFAKETEAEVEMGSVLVKAGPDGLTVTRDQDGSMMLEGVETKILDGYLPGTDIPQSITECSGMCDLNLDNKGYVASIDIVREGTDSKGKPYDTIVTTLDPQTSEPILKIDPSATTTYYPPYSTQSCGITSGKNCLQFNQAESKVSANIVEGNKVNLGMYEKPLDTYQLTVDRTSALGIGLLTAEGKRTNTGFIIENGQAFGSNFFTAFENTNIETLIHEADGSFSKFSYNPKEGFAEMDLIQAQWTCIGKDSCVLGARGSKYLTDTCGPSGDIFCLSWENDNEYFDRNGGLIDKSTGKYINKDGSECVDQSKPCAQSNNVAYFEGGTEAESDFIRSAWVGDGTREGEIITLGPTGTRYTAELCPGELGGMCYRYNANELYTAEGKLIDKDGNWISKDGSECTEDNSQCFSLKEAFFKGGDEEEIEETGISIFDDNAFAYEGSAFKVFAGDVYARAIDAVTKGNGDTGLIVNPNIYNIETTMHKFSEEELETVIPILEKFPTGQAQVVAEQIALVMEKGKFVEGGPILVHDITTGRIYGLVNGKYFEDSAGNAYSGGQAIFSNVLNSNSQPIGTSVLRTDEGIGYLGGLRMDGQQERSPGSDYRFSGTEKAFDLDPNLVGNDNNLGRGIILHGPKETWSYVERVNGRLVLKKPQPGISGDDYTWGCSQFRDIETLVEVINSAMDHSTTFEDGTKGGGVITVIASGSEGDLLG